MQPMLRDTRPCHCCTRCCSIHAPYSYARHYWVICWQCRTCCATPGRVTVAHAVAASTSPMHLRDTIDSFCRFLFMYFGLICGSLFICVGLFWCLDTIDSHVDNVERAVRYGVAASSRLLKITGFFCKRNLEKRRYSAKETHNSKEPTNRSHPIAGRVTVAYVAQVNTSSWEVDMSWWLSLLIVATP